MFCSVTQYCEHPFTDLRTSWLRDVSALNKTPLSLNPASLRALLQNRKQFTNSESRSIAGPSIHDSLLRRYDAQVMPRKMEQGYGSSHDRHMAEASTIRSMIMLYSGIVEIARVS